MSGEVIDIHLHFGAPEDQASGCYWSEEFTRTPAYVAMLLLTKSLFKKVDFNNAKQHIFETIKGSTCIDKFVLLAMDEVYDIDENRLRDKTHLCVPNKCIIDLAKENNRILFGASVHPYRGDWEQALDYCLENKAVLCKWIPSSQLIDPSHEKCKNFYEKLVQHKLPLLCHVGAEYAIPSSAPEPEPYNNPDLLVPALDEGVTVIMPHCAMPYFGPLEKPIYQEHFEKFLNLMDQADAKGWNLYADLSAICIPSRSEYVPRVLDHVPSHRLLYGSDYPVPLTEFCYHKGKNVWDRLLFIIKMAFTENLLDKNYHLIKEMGFEEIVFNNASELFAHIVS